MLGFLSQFSAFGNVFGGSACAVGVDLGTETLRLAQVHPDPEHPQLIAAASRDVPPELADDPVGYAEYCGRALKEMWREGAFAGKRAVLGLPSSMLHLLHLRLPKTDADKIPQALAFEVAGKLPFDPMAAMLRHHVVGDVYNNDGPKQEVICTAVRRDFVELLLAAAEKARLDVVGLVAAPVALRDCFGRIYRRTADAETGFCVIDLGRASTRVTIMRGGHLYFARSVAIGAEHLNKAVANALGVQSVEAKLLRAQLAEQHALADADRAAPSAVAATAAPRERGDSGSELSAAASRSNDAHGAVAMADAPRATAAALTGGSSLVTEMTVTQAIEPVLHNLADELQRCRRYHEATFPNAPVDRLVFVGGEAHGRSLCQALARRMGVAAQLGDPIASLCHAGRDGVRDFVAAGIDRRRPQPGWAVACGLSLGAT